MAGTVPAITSDWLQTLRAAANRLAAGGAAAQVFLEFREDRRAGLDTAGARESVVTRLSGASVREGVPPGPARFLTDPTPEAVEALVRREPPPDPTRLFPAPFLEEPPRTADPFRTLERVLDGAVRERPGGGRLFASARWVGFDQAVAVARGDSLVVADRRMGSRVRVDVRVAAGGREASATAERVVRAGGESGVDEIGAETVRRACERLESADVPTGTMPVVFAAGAGGVVLHEIVGHALEADTVERGGSLLATADRVAPRGVSISDDPRRGRGAWHWDDEGCAARATLLLGDGRVAGTMHDQRTSANAGVVTTGHGRRASFRDPVRPRMGCTFLVTGSLERSELTDVMRGVLVRRLEAVSNDPSSGIAMFRVSDADRIERGRITRPLRPFMLEAQVISALASLDAVGDDLEFDTCIGTCLRDGQPMPTSVGAPTFRIGVIRVSN